MVAPSISSSGDRPLCLIKKKKNTNYLIKRITIPWYQLFIIYYNVVLKSPWRFITNNKLIRSFWTLQILQWTLSPGPNVCPMNLLMCSKPHLPTPMSTKAPKVVTFRTTPSNWVPILRSSIDKTLDLNTGFTKSKKDVENLKILINGVIINI